MKVPLHPPPRITEVIFTNQLSFPYQVIGIYDSDASVDSILYKNDPFIDCTVFEMELIQQSLYAPVQDQVMISPLIISAQN